MAQIVVAFSNGNSTVNPDIHTDRWYARLEDGTPSYYCLGPGKGTDENTGEEYDDNILMNCCAWETNGGAVAWIVFAMWLLSWISFTLFELRTFFTAGPEQGDRVEATRNPPS